MLYTPTARNSHGTFGVLELPAMNFRVYRAKDGELVLDDALKNE